MAIMKKVREIMISPPVTVPLDRPLSEVANLMQAMDIGSVLVVDDQGSLKGIITESDFTGIARCVPFSLELAPVIFGMRAATYAELQKIYEKARNLKAKDVMSAKVATVSPDATVADAVHQMMAKNLKHIPVVEGGKAVGVIARHDILRLMLAK